MPTTSQGVCQTREMAEFRVFRQRRPNAHLRPSLKVGNFHQHCATTIPAGVKALAGLLAMAPKWRSTASPSPPSATMPRPGWTAPHSSTCWWGKTVRERPTCSKRSAFLPPVGACAAPAWRRWRAKRAMAVSRSARCWRMDPASPCASAPACAQSGPVAASCRSMARKRPLSHWANGWRSAGSHQPWTGFLPTGRVRGGAIWTGWPWRWTRLMPVTPRATKPRCANAIACWPNREYPMRSGWQG